MKDWPISQRYDAMRGWFAYDLYYEMKKNKNIWLVTADLGYVLFDKIRDKFPDRFICSGASEQTAIGLAVGLTYRGKIPFVYSITNFLLYRPFEFIRNYIDHEKAPVKLIAGGRDLDYKEDGYTHQSLEAHDILNVLPNIKQYWPEDKKDLKGLVHKVANNNKPTFVSLKRKW